MQKHRIMVACTIRGIPFSLGRFSLFSCLVLFRLQRGQVCEAKKLLRYLEHAADCRSSHSSPWVAILMADTRSSTTLPKWWPATVTFTSLPDFVKTIGDTPFIKYTYSSPLAVVRCENLEIISSSDGLFITSFHFKPERVRKVWPLQTRLQSLDLKYLVTVVLKHWVSILASGYLVCSLWTIPCQVGSRVVSLDVSKWLVSLQRPSYSH